MWDGSAYPLIDAVSFTIRRIAGIVEELTILLTGWALIRWDIRFERVSAFFTLPAFHNTFSLSVYLG